MEKAEKTYEEFYSEFSPDSIAFSNVDVEEHKYSNNCEDSESKMVIDPVKDAEVIAEALELAKKIGF